jgi:predicted transcriptional regulator
MPNVDSDPVPSHKGVVNDYIRNHPGTHVRSIGKDLRLANGDLQYHILWLEKNGFVKTRRSGFYRFVYPARAFKEREEVLLSLLTQHTPRELLLHLICRPGSTQRDLAILLGHSQPTISWHMERLVEAGVAAKKRTSKGFAYQVTTDQDNIVRFLKTYHRDVWERWEVRLGAVTSPHLKHAEQGGDTRQPALMAPAVVRLIGSG